MRHNRHDIWAAFCAEHREVLAATGLPTAVTHNKHRFRDLLEYGRVEAVGGEVALAQLTATEWAALYQFAAAFIRDFESFAPEDLFPAFRREVEARGNKFPR